MPDPNGQSDGDAYRQRMVERCQQGRDIVCERLSEVPEVQLIPPQGTFYLFFRMAGESDSMAFAKRLVDQANVGLAPGSAFGSGGEGFIRLCYACSHDTLRTGVDRLVAALT